MMSPSEYNHYLDYFVEVRDNRQMEMKLSQAKKEQIAEAIMDAFTVVEFAQALLELYIDAEDEASRKAYAGGFAIMLPALMEDMGIVITE